MKLDTLFHLGVTRGQMNLSDLIGFSTLEASMTAFHDESLLVNIELISRRSLAMMILLIIS